MTLFEIRRFAITNLKNGGEVNRKFKMQKSKFKPVLLFILIVLALVPQKVEAKWFQQARKEIKKVIREEVRENFGLTGTPSPGLKNEVREQIRTQVKEQVKELREKHNWLLPFGFNQVEIKSISSITPPANLGVSKEDKTYTVKVTEKTLLLRKFGGKSDLAEFSVGDIVSVRGKWTDETKTTLEARVIRNLSIQKRKGTFWGTIKSKETDGKTFVLTSVNKGDQTVITGEGTKIVDRAAKAITFADLKVGDRVRVSGLWDSKLNKITEVTRIKDWSIGPVKISPTPTS